WLSLGRHPPGHGAPARSRVATYGRTARDARCCLEGEVDPLTDCASVILRENSTFYFYRGRVALYALLRALEVGAGDEGLVPAFTCIAVPSPILGTGARPVYVDIDPHTYNLDPRELEKRIGRRSRVVIAQHTYGIPCDMDGIMAIAQKH